MEMTYFGLMKNLYSKKSVMVNEKIPTTASATKFLPVTSHAQSWFCSSQDLWEYEAICTQQRCVFTMTFDLDCQCFEFVRLFHTNKCTEVVLSYDWVKMSIMPLPRAKLGNTRKTTFRTSETSAKCWIKKKTTHIYQFLRVIPWNVTFEAAASLFYFCLAILKEIIKKKISLNWSSLLTLWSLKISSTNVMNIGRYPGEDVVTLPERRMPH